MNEHDIRSSQASLPLVSVIVPLYNGSLTVARTLRSLMVQDYANIELVIIDDASTDDSAKVVEEFVSLNKLNATIVRHEVNQGIARTWNHGVDTSSGPLVLIVHQDIELLDCDWISRAVTIMRQDADVAVVSGNYGIPASDELTFVVRAFGLIRRQFHRSPACAQEYVTFSEFKCDLVRKSVLQEYGGFPASYEVGGQDIVMSYLIRRGGRRILKVYNLRAIQRFTGQAESLFGNLRKEFSFGEGNARVFSRFRTFAFENMGDSSYASSRFFHRALQLPVALTILLASILYAGTGTTFSMIVLGLLVGGRLVSYVVRLWPDFRLVVPARARLVPETIGAGIIGIVSDFTYSAGSVAGFVRHATENVSRKG